LPPVAALAHASGNVSNSPAAAQPGIVLPAFARSGPADVGAIIKHLLNNTHSRKRAKASQKTGPGCFALRGEGFF
jgi:hypothetical protein